MLKNLCSLIICFSTFSHGISQIHSERNNEELEQTYSSSDIDAYVYNSLNFLSENKKFIKVWNYIIEKDISIGYVDKPELEGEGQLIPFSSDSVTIYFNSSEALSQLTVAHEFFHVYQLLNRNREYVNSLNAEIEAYMFCDVLALELNMSSGIAITNEDNPHYKQFIQSYDTLLYHYYNEKDYNIVLASAKKATKRFSNPPYVNKNILSLSNYKCLIDIFLPVFN